MGKVKVLTKKEKLAFAVVAALAMTSGGFAFGQSVNNVSSDQIIYACVTGVNGNITKVSNTPKTCPKGTTPISWNAAGPKGDQGIQGSPGAKGEKGDPGSSAISNLPQTFVVNTKTGLKYPVFNTPYGLGVVIDNIVYGYSGNPNFPLGILGGGGGAYFYTTSNCSGQRYRVGTAREFAGLPLVSKYGSWNKDGEMELAIVERDAGLVSNFVFRGAVQGQDGCIEINTSNVQAKLLSLYNLAKSTWFSLKATNPSAGYLVVNREFGWIEGRVDYEDGTGNGIERQYAEGFSEDPIGIQNAKWRLELQASGRSDYECTNYHYFSEELSTWDNCFDAINGERQDNVSRVDLDEFFQPMMLNGNQSDLRIVTE